MPVSLNFPLMLVNVNYAGQNVQVTIYSPNNRHVEFPFKPLLRENNYVNRLCSHVYISKAILQ